MTISLTLRHFIHAYPPKVGEFSNPDGEKLEKGQTFRLDLDEALGDSTRVMLPHPEIIEASEVDHVLLIDDGKVKLTVVVTGDKYLECRVDVPGKISNRKVRSCVVTFYTRMRLLADSSNKTSAILSRERESIPLTVFWILALSLPKIVRILNTCLESALIGSP